MDNVKNDLYYSKKIRDNMVFLVRHTKGLSQKEIENNEILLDSIMFRLIQISEDSIKLTEKFKK